jgi:transmembrane sensor
LSEILKLRTRADIEEEAAQWVWRLDSASTGSAEQAAFDAWLRQDPRHRRAFNELSGVWNALDGLESAKGTLDGATPRSPELESFLDVDPRATRRMVLRFAAAAPVLLAVGVGVFWMRAGNETQTLATAVGQQRNVTLADGSIITLNTNSIVETDLSPGLRQIYLRKGEAHFQVAHDRSRPFLVHAGDAVVRAVGTEFEVRLRPDQHVDVVVNEGRVEVQAAAPGSGPGPGPDPSGGPGRSSLRALRAGERLSTASADYSVQQVSAAQLSSEMAWREGAIIFDGQPLAAAIAEIERYTDARIIVSDPRTAALKVGGRFRTDDVQGFFAGLQSALPVTVRRTPDGVIYIDPRR